MSYENEHYPGESFTEWTLKKKVAELERELAACDEDRRANYESRRETETRAAELERELAASRSRADLAESLVGEEAIRARSAEEENDASIRRAEAAEARAAKAETERDELLVQVESAKDATKYVADRGLEELNDAQERIEEDAIRIARAVKARRAAEVRVQAAEARASALAAGLEEALDAWADARGMIEGYMGGDDGDEERLRALLAAGPSEAAAELAGLRAVFDACAPPCWYVFIPPLYELQACKRRATKRASKPYFDEGVTEFLSRDYCDEHAPEGSTDLPWAFVVRAAAGRGGSK